MASDMSSSPDVSLPPEATLWKAMRHHTQARIGLGRVGDAIPVRRELEFRAAHASARDAVYATLDRNRLTPDIERLFGPPIVVSSQARDRREYLTRPDLGRTLDDSDLDGELQTAPLTSTDADVAIVLADGLSAKAVNEHGVELLTALHDELTPNVRLAPLVIATQARVALGDDIGARLGVDTVIVVIGERPGLSATDSLGVYITYDPRPGRVDSERNCVSNIRPPRGLSYKRAARITANIVRSARQLGASGVGVKDTLATDAEMIGETNGEIGGEIDSATGTRGPTATSNPLEVGVEVNAPGK